MTEQQYDESKLERVIRKIKRCLALSKSSNENEAATAMRQAQALMREYRLTELDVRLSDVSEAQSEKSRANRRPTWDRHLSSIVAQLFGVRHLSYQHWCRSASRRVDRAIFVGVTPAQQIAMYAYEALLAKLTLVRREYVAMVRSGQRRSAYVDDSSPAWAGPERCATAAGASAPRNNGITDCGAKIGCSLSARVYADRSGRITSAFSLRRLFA